MRLFLDLLKLVPRNILSYFIGIFFRIKWPDPFREPILRAFMYITGISLKEALDGESLGPYKSVEMLFTRKLGAGLRPLSSAALVSPCDGTLVGAARVDGGSIFQAKNLPYSLADLLGETIDLGAQNFFALTIYLAPHNYHRVHTPLACRLLKIKYIPGDLWPVNEAAKNKVPGLYVRNERLVFFLADEKTASPLYLVMVGALNVGRISTPFWKDFMSNDLSFFDRTSVKHILFPGGVRLNAIDELGIFHLGSTVILVLGDKISSSFIEGPSEVKLGESLLSL